MSTGQKRPPINVNELDKKEGEGSSKGPGDITYAGKRGAGSSGRGGGSLSGVLLPVVISVVITGMLLFGFTATKGDVRTLDSNIKVVNDSLAAYTVSVDETIKGLQGDVATAISEARSAKTSIEGKVDASTLEAYTTKESVDQKFANILPQYATTEALTGAVEGFATKEYVDEQLAKLSDEIPTIPNSSELNEWQVYVRSVLSGSYLNFEVVAGSNMTAVIYVEVEPISGSGVWSALSAPSVGGNLTQEQALRYFEEHSPIGLRAGLTNLAPMYTLAQGADGTWYLRMVTFVTPWFEVGATKITKALTYESYLAGVSYKIVTRALPITTTSTSGGW